MCWWLEESLFGLFGVGYHDVLSVTLFFRIIEGEGGEDQLLGENLLGENQF